jgi:glyoxylase-like metal-dependent hydrolase (beta-lactamase superfamily II)
VGYILKREPVKDLEQINMYLKQIQQHGDNFSYIVADEKTLEAAVIDSSYNASEIARMLETEQFKLKYIINTHGHSDHTAGNEALLNMSGGKVVAHRLSRLNRDIVVDEGDILKIGSVQIRVLHTPGHTPDGICLLVDEKKLLTGDTLFVGECGRTDMPGGNAKDLYYSFFNKLMKLDDDIEVYPGHDYGARPKSTIGDERKSNYVLQPRSLQEFLEFMGAP